MRNMSFMLTTAQIRDETKDVTRRLGWKFLKPGDLVMACVKCQGLGKGGKIEKIHPIEIISVEQECLLDMADRPRRDELRETDREGFPDMTEIEFIHMFAKEMKCNVDDWVTRIEFKHRKDLLKKGLQ